MHQALRLAPNVTLRLTPRAPDFASRSPSTLRIKANLASQPRGTLGPITNTVSGRDEAAVVDPTPRQGKGNLITLPTSDVLPTGIATPLRPRPVEPSVPGPFLQICTIRQEVFSTVVAVRDMNGGRDLRRGRPMCLKIMRREEEREMLARELAAYVALSKAARGDWVPYVMRLEASLEEAYHVYFVMEMMDCDLMDVLTTWEPELRKIHRKQWVAQIATGLAAIHEAGIIHRDLKPENILVDFRFNVRIGDLGCSYTSPNGRAVHTFGKYCDEVIGTWPYMAPDVLSNKGRPCSEKIKYSLQVDYWALGLIIFELEQDVEEPMPLFAKEPDLWAYVRYRPVNYDGRSYLASKGFSFGEDAESLILGLLRVTPHLRFGHLDIRRHKYFQGIHGYSEFNNIEARGHALNQVPIGHDIPSDRLKPDGVRAIYSPLAYDPEDHAGINYSWINPEGIWGSTGK
ncbi:kinase-like domain-containing protein [Lyophyllum atratum]|nr:kinase-like domain-containing protein [Lyophyllum atratum]